MKKVIIVILALFLIILSTSFVDASEQPIKIIIDNQEITSDSLPIINSSRVLVPVRVISEELGYAVSWVSKTNTVYISKGNVSIKFIIGESKILVSGKSVQLDVASSIVNGRAYLPIRVVSESIGSSINWDGSTKSVIIDTKDNDEESNSSSEVSLSFSTDKRDIMIDQIFKLKQPNRLVIDFDQMLVEDLIIPEIEDNNLIENIRFSQFELEPNKVRVVIDLKYDVDYSYELDDNLFLIDLNTHVYKVVIDAGHGGKDPGATGVSGNKEKDLNLLIALKLANFLKYEPNIELILTRRTDVYISLDGRINLANAANADIFISIHHNSMPYNSSITGSETYYKKSDSIELAKIAHANLLDATGFIDRNTNTANFRVIKYTEMPAILLEVGYMSNYLQEKQMKEQAFQDKVVAGIADTINEYFNR